LRPQLTTRTFQLLFIVFLCISSRAQTAKPRPAVPTFEEIAARAGLTVSHIASPEKKYIVESMSGGVGFIDCDNSGTLSALVVNGSTVVGHGRRRRRF
jgi:enediyne biosynthesis protein E4